MYKFGHYLLDTGWGGLGIYDASKTIKKRYQDNTLKELSEDEAKQYPSDSIFVRDVIPLSAVMAGTGEGWESEIEFDEEWCEKVVNMLNKLEDKDENLHCM